MRRLRVLVWKEFLELRMDPRLFGIVILAPIVQLTLLGYAATTDIRDVPIVVADGDRSRASRELVQRFEASTTFTVVETVTTVSDIDPFLERGRAWLALSIPAGYGDDLERGVPAVLQIVADGTDSNSTSGALGYATALIGSYARELLETGRLKPAPTVEDSSGQLKPAPTVEDSSGQLKPAPTVEDSSGQLKLAPTVPGENRDPGVGAGFSRPTASFSRPTRGTIDARIRVWFNPQLESRFFMIPGVLALVLLVVTTNLAAMAIVREKEIGTLEQLNVTPLRRWELIAGKLLPYGLIGMVDVLLVTAVAVFWFEVPLRGSFWLLFGLSVLYVVCTLALGLLVSTLSSTQQQAMITATFFFLMPMIYLSGFLAPIENMPEPIQWATYLMPLRYFLVIVRGIFLKGVGAGILWPQIAALGAWATVVLSLAVLRSTKRSN